MLNIGDTAPDFSLKTKNAEGLKDISLSDHKGEQAVVLLFFPRRRLFQNTIKRMRTTRMI